MKEIYEQAIKPLLPKVFDRNEWFVIAITILVSICVYYITVKNRQLLWSEILCISLFNLQLTTLGDYFFAMPPYDFYDTVDKNSGELSDIFLQNIAYPGTLLYMMHVYKVKKLRKVTFLILATVLLTIMEIISVKVFYLFTFKTWKTLYSVGFYFLVVGANVILYEKLKKYLAKRMRSASP